MSCDAVLEEYSAEASREKMCSCSGRWPDNLVLGSKRNPVALFPVLLCLRERPGLPSAELSSGQEGHLAHGSGQGASGSPSRGFQASSPTRKLFGVRWVL